MDIRRQVAMSIYESIGGDPNKHFDTVEDIYDEIETIYKSQDYRLDVESLNIHIDSNGTYIFDDRDVQGYKPVSVEVKVAGGGDYNTGYDDGVRDQKSKLESITITQNGLYEKEDGYNEVVVNVAGTGEKQIVYNGFRFDCDGPDDYQYLKDIDFSLYDWSRVYNLTNFFNGFKSSDDTKGLVASDFDNFVENFNGDIRLCGRIFGNSTLLELPNFGDLTKDCINIDSLLSGNQIINDVTNLQYWNLGNVKSMEGVFGQCTNLTNIPIFNTSNTNNMSYMFDYCSKLGSIPHLDTSKATNMSYMFRYCGSLTSIPHLDTSKATNMQNMFEGCSSLTTIPHLDTGNVTNMDYTFYSCSSLTSIPHLDTGNVTNMQNMFGSCSSLTTIPQLNTGNVTNMDYTFYSCSSLTSVPLLDCGKVNSVSRMFGYLTGNLTNLTDLGGFKDLGKYNGVVNGVNSNFLDRCPNLTHESLMNVINNLFDRKSAGYSTLTLNMGSTNLAKLTDEEKSVAINKGWNLS